MNYCFIHFTRQYISIHSTVNGWCALDFCKIGLLALVHFHFLPIEWKTCAGTQHSAHAMRFMNEFILSPNTNRGRICFFFFFKLKYRIFKQIEVNFYHYSYIQLMRYFAFNSSFRICNFIRVNFCLCSLLHFWVKRKGKRKRKKMKFLILNWLERQLPSIALHPTCPLNAHILHRFN